VTRTDHRENGGVDGPSPPTFPTSSETHWHTHISTATHGINVTDGPSSGSTHLFIKVSNAAYASSERLTAPRAACCRPALWKKAPPFS
jgi:hypothetical protein